MAWSALLALVLIASAGAAPATPDRAVYGMTHDGYRLPDRGATPGVIAHRDLTTICTTKWGKDSRHVTEAMKRRTYDRYRATKVKDRCCEIDHLLSRDLGGADDERNLWPQPWTQARLKDRVEVEAKKRVCARRVDLAETQATMMRDWTVLYRDWFGALPKGR